ncbi:hypothetical protein BDN72DRAFT_959492 [Pluteus cervinus]|uniref:Uncharacterized protein n=1 Tax=Pluteus cervinus TaxID=181527 RepID=A0ACD3AW05_9AGAR|nr:hypothetical protein BDN72DRAFT_959492 [Pluteus cervinus]
MSMPKGTAKVAQAYTGISVDNQGIVDGRPAGQQPKPAPVTLDTIVDPDASEDAGNPLAGNSKVRGTLGGMESDDGGPVVERVEEFGLHVPKKEPVRHAPGDSAAAERIREKAAEPVEVDKLRIK